LNGLAPDRLDTTQEPRPSHARRSGATKVVGFQYTLITNLTVNPPELIFGQEVIHGDLQCLHYHLVHMQKLSSKIQEVMEYQR
jgi:hypothetical protein